MQKNNVVVLTNKHRGIDFQMAKHASMLEHCTTHLPTLYLLILLVLCSHIACLHWNLKTCGQRSELSTMLNLRTTSLAPKHKNIPCESITLLSMVKVKATYTHSKYWILAMSTQIWRELKLGLSSQNFKPEHIPTIFSGFVHSNHYTKVTPTQPIVCNLWATYGGSNCCECNNVRSMCFSSSITSTSPVSISIIRPIITHSIANNWCPPMEVLFLS